MVHRAESSNNVSDAIQQRILQYQIIDRQIFEHFNGSFDRHIEKIGRDKFNTLLAEFQRSRLEFEDACFDKDRVVGGTYHSTSWAVSNYGQTVNRTCSFLQIPDITLTRVVTQLQLSHDYEIEIERELVMPELIKWVQNDYQSRRGSEK